MTSSTFVDLKRKIKRPTLGKVQRESALTSSRVPVLPGHIVQRALADVGRLAPNDMLQLQRTIGNRAVSDLLQRGEQRAQGGVADAGPLHTPAPMIQTKLTVGAAHDRFEQEADHVARSVGQETADKQQAPHNEQRPELDAGFEQQLNRNKIGGMPLPASVQREVGAELGRDLSGVRYHNDTEAHELSKQAGAKAFTNDQHIFFGKGRFAPESDAGRNLLAHEVTHTIQQAPEKAPATGIQRNVKDNLGVPAMGRQAPQIQREDDDTELRKQRKKLRKKQVGARAKFKVWKMADTLLTLPISLLDHITALPIHMIDGVNFMLSGGKTWKDQAPEGIAKGNQNKNEAPQLSGPALKAKMARKGGLTGIRAYLSGFNYHEGVFGKGMSGGNNFLAGKYNPLSAWSRIGSGLKKEKKDLRFQKKGLGKKKLTFNRKVDKESSSGATIGDVLSEAMEENSGS